MRNVVGTILMMAGLGMAGLNALGGEPDGPAAVELMRQGKVKEGLAILERLAANGDDRAMVELGLCYYEGRLGKPDYAVAMDWFLKAFRKENADAFTNLGVMHRDGQGVPQNKKIAYCVFLTTHMCGLGSPSTQERANRCLRRLMEELPKEDLKDCLSNYTLAYVTAYLEAKGSMQGIPDTCKPSKENPALRDLDWWLDGELDALYGEPTEQEKQARLERAGQREQEYAALRHTLVFQVRFPGATASRYCSYSIVTETGMGSGPIRTNELTASGHSMVYEKSTSITADQRRYVTVEDNDRKNLVYEIRHPVQPSPCDWSTWQKPAYVLMNSMDTFTLLDGGEPKSKTSNTPADAPELRFKVVK